RQGMLEGVFELRKQSLFVDQLECREFPQARLGALGAFGDPVEHTAAELSADNGGHLKDTLGALGESIDPRRNDALDGIRDEDVFEWLCQRVALWDTPDTAGFLERLDEFLDEKRVAFRLTCEQGLEVVG